ncbi:hypothetical protein H4V97_002675 [Flavobacterium sp. CG_23.5]|uniref:hypothetical protein n=1 Tax=unclassified Flavobacterium TaxID=196869 RepID=UPI0018C9C0C2|nr:MULTISPECIES: hypothetical protein [unclassified Flavobacterium]MBG6111153.1 hypothetical protein [Flavobacterium sp. CG_9.10]MBP2284357.1 hypothetical protein [Flavobacterium sp. CG_23.5]
MENLRYRPKGNFTWEAEWQHLYTVTEHWLSDLQFYKDDLDFLYHLIDKYFLWLAQKDNLAEMKELTTGLSGEIKEYDKLVQKTAKHLMHLSELIDDPFKYDSHQFRSEHEELENEIADFVKKFRKNKKETFAITEQAIKKEIKKRLMP